MKWWAWILAAVVVWWLWEHRAAAAVSVGTLGTVENSTVMHAPTFWEDDTLSGGGGGATVTVSPGGPVALADPSGGWTGDSGGAGVGAGGTGVVRLVSDIAPYRPLGGGGGLRGRLVLK